ncbi:NUDIX hydrolase [Pseudoclavibacter terrae]|uniref:NUDIX domain-containing protein n=1 Tax=Pseudoclavibacter terrae TaxID=1530195 RepID=A0A7J5B1Y0_9MICO|nr:NUDIX domain-containing protein [Pseudoclavibacter terrae]KAB1638037.1 NUDIX domain-containing protein [Pseudoclavibacter terrae]
MPASVLTVAAICFEDSEGRVLTVRKRGTTKFMLPGGKLEPGESPKAAAIREIEEEVGIVLDGAEVTFLGEWTTAAANEAATDLVGTVYLAALTGEPQARAEIDELRWVDAYPGPEADLADLAPLLSECVMPELRRRRDARG